MFYRIRLDLAFTDYDAIDDIIDKAIDHLDDSVIINPNVDNEERGYILTEKCYHDEHPTKPCEVIHKLHAP